MTFQVLQVGTTDYSPTKMLSRAVSHHESNSKNSKATLQNLNKIRCGRPKTGRSDTNIGQVKAFSEQHTTSSIRNVASASELSIPTPCRILKKDLHMKPYKPQVNQLLSDNDRETFCILAVHQRND